jgi:hypothetical protein
MDEDDGQDDGENDAREAVLEAFRQMGVPLKERAQHE